LFLSIFFVHLFYFHFLSLSSSSMYVFLSSPPIHFSTSLPHHPSIFQPPILTCLPDFSKTRLLPSTEVLYRDPKKRTPTTEGEGILCRVTSVIGEGKQRRYEIIDADPDPPTPSIPYRASVNHLVPIPANTNLPDLAKGKNVLALYPGTTTFYKAEVVQGWRLDEMGEGDGLVRLRFEGEDEADREMSVERRYVLPDR
jgi:SAGA-associated factor 29